MATARSPVRPCLASVVAEREAFGELDLGERELDPALCLRHLNAIVSPHPYDLEAVAPVAEFDLSHSAALRASRWDGKIGGVVGVCAPATHGEREHGCRPFRMTPDLLWCL
nr:hypothetical protein [Streptomyces sp. 846.5]